MAFMRLSFNAMTRTGFRPAIVVADFGGPGDIIDPKVE
jgi:hypothetical protein